MRQDPRTRHSGLRYLYLASTRPLPRKGGKLSKTTRMRESRAGVGGAASHCPENLRNDTHSSPPGPALKVTRNLSTIVARFQDNVERKEGRKHPKSLFTQDLHSTGENEVSCEEAGAKGGCQEGLRTPAGPQDPTTKSALIPSLADRGPCTPIPSAHLWEISLQLTSAPRTHHGGLGQGRQALLTLTETDCGPQIPTELINL